MESVKRPEEANALLSQFGLMKNRCGKGIQHVAEDGGGGWHPYLSLWVK